MATATSTMLVILVCYCRFISIISITLQPYKNSEKYFETQVEFLKDILHFHDEIQNNCNLILAHTIPSLPYKFVAALNGISTRPWFEFTLPSKDPQYMTTQVTPEENTTSFNVYPWPSNPKSVPTGICAVYVLLFHENSALEELLKYLSTLIAIELQRDYFLLLKMNSNDLIQSDVEEILVNNTMVYSMKYKLFPVVSGDGEMQLYSLCFFCKERSKVIGIGKYNTEKKFQDTEELFPDFTKNLNNTRFKLVYVYPGGKEEIREEIAGSDPVFIANSLMFLVSEALNFDFYFYVIDIGISGAFDRQVEDGTWVGLVGDVLYGKADFAAATILKPEPMNYVDFSIITTSTFFFTTAKPKLFFSQWVVIETLSPGLWCSILALILLSTVILGILLKYESERIYFQNWSTSGRYFYSFFYLTFSLIGWSTDIMPTRSAPRIIISVWLLFAIIISFFYQSELTSLMTVPGKEKVPETFKEILDMGYAFGGEGLINAYFQIVLEETNIDHMIKIRDNIISYDTIYDCLSLALEEKLACIGVPQMMDGPIYSFLDDDYRILHTTDIKDGTNIFGATVFPKGHVIRSSFSRVLQSLHDTGLYGLQDKEIIHRNFRKALKRQQRINANKPESDINRNQFDALTLKHIVASFSLLGLGSSIAAVLFAIEHINSRFKISTITKHQLYNDKI